MLTLGTLNGLARQCSRPVLLAVFAGSWAVPVFAAEPLAPQTKLDLTVVQWNPVEGQYQKLDAVSGQLTVAADGSVTVPLVGKLAVESNTPEQLAAIIATRIKSKIGLVDRPEVTVEVSAYPPIYVLGDVTTSGEFAFRPGMTVLQALALGGGEVKATSVQDAQKTRLLGEMQTGEAEILRSMAHIARFNAELAGASTITFPPELSIAPKGSQVAQIVEQEELVFKARNDAIKRQEQSFEELKALLLAEVDVLQQKAGNLDSTISAREQEFQGVKTLVDQGIATVTRRTDLELALASLRADRLDNMTATMRARQALSEAQRNLAAIQDQRKTDSSSQLQAEDAKLDQLRIAQATSRSLLFDLPEGSKAADARPTLTFTIIRQKPKGGVDQFVADETTQLVPGDVVKVVSSAPALPPAAAPSDGSPL